MQATHLQAHSHTGLPGYAVPAEKGNFVALFVPELAHIWTNPDCSKKEIETILVEEFVHATQTSFRPSQLLPLRNFLTGGTHHPSHDEFRDIIEAVFYASWPLAHNVLIDPKQPPPLYSPYSKLGCSILNVAVALARHRSSELSEAAARQKALWALLLALLDVVPLKSGQGRQVIEVLGCCIPSETWSDTAHLLGVLLKHLANSLNKTPVQRRTFALVRPNDPHQLLFRAVDVFADFTNAAAHRLVPTIPVLLSVLSFDIVRNIHLLWWRKRGARLEPSFEVWPFTGQNIRALTKAFVVCPATQVTARRDAEDSGPCVARLVHMNSFSFLRELNERQQAWSYPFLAHELLELLPSLFNAILLPALRTGTGCDQCQGILGDARFRERATALASISTKRKLDLITAASHYGQWLKTECPRKALELSTPRFAPLPNAIVRIRAGQPKHADSHAYSYSCGEGRKLGLFLPALNQIWILPGCSRRLLTQIQSHEQHHFNFCAYQPAQLLHFRHVLLNRAMPEPFRFNDIVEAGYTLGLTLDAGLPPHKHLFPPAPPATLKLASMIAATGLRFSSSSSVKAGRIYREREATYAILLLLQHVVPNRSGCGTRIMEFMEKLPLPRGWKSRWDLWPRLHRGLFKVLKKTRHSASRPPFALAWPMDPHRTVAEMLVFLSHCLLPIPERSEAALKTLPCLLNILSLGSLMFLPIIRFRERSGFYDAYVDFLQPSRDFDESVTKAIQMQVRVLRRVRQKHVVCECISYFVQLLRRTAPFRRPACPSQMKLFLESILNTMDVNRFRSSRFSCVSCRDHLTAPTVADALERIDLMLVSGKGPLLDLAAAYETWLLFDNIEMARKANGISKPVRVLKRF